MSYRILCSARTLAVAPVVLSMALGLSTALTTPALAQSNNVNPLTSQTPPPGAPAVSTPGTTASPGSVNTAPQKPAVSIPAAPGGGTTAPATGAAMAPAHPAPHRAASGTAAGAPGRAKSGQTMQERVDAQITRLHRELKITSAQDTQWNTFAQVMRDNAQKMDGLYAQSMQGAADRNAVQDMQSYAALSKAHADSVQALVDPFQALYASMSDSQKKTADAVFHRAQQRGPHRG